MDDRDLRYVWQEAYDEGVFHGDLVISPLARMSLQKNVDYLAHMKEIIYGHKVVLDPDLPGIQVFVRKSPNGDNAPIIDPSYE